MKISVVTISFNQAQFLRQCIDSVLSQDGVDFEYIIVDPGSTDGSREIIDSYGDRVIRVYEKDAGPADGLNKGFAQATGDVLYFINSDDYVYNGAFKYALRYFDEDSELDVLLCAGSQVDGNSTRVRDFYPSRPSIRAYVNGAMTFYQQGMFFRNVAFNRAGGFNISNNTCWDGELLFNLLLNRVKIARSSNKVAAFRIYPESITGSQRFAALYDKDQERMFQMVYGRVKGNLFQKKWYHVLKLIADPFYLYHRIFK